MEEESRQENQRPFVTLTWAQSIDGSMAIDRSLGQLPLSCPSTMRMTHKLRASHHAILVGSGTVKSDNPSLSVRYAVGPHPRPVILDKDLSIPLTCKVLSAVDRAPIVFYSSNSAPKERIQQFYSIPGLYLMDTADAAGSRLDFHKVLSGLAAHGIRSIMIEGGPTLLSSILSNSPEVVDQIIVTITPRFVGGTAMATQSLISPTSAFPTLIDPLITTVESDVVYQGKLELSTKLPGKPVQVKR